MTLGPPSVSEVCALIAREHASSTLAELDAMQRLVSLEQRLAAYSERLRELGADGRVEDAR